MKGWNLFIRGHTPRGLIKVERWLGLNQNSVDVHFGKFVLAKDVNDSYHNCTAIKTVPKEDSAYIYWLQITY